jgi:flavin-dependent dehydrogenase
MLVRALHPHLGDPRESPPRAWFGLKAHRLGRPPGIGSEVDLHVFDGGYAGLAAVEEDRVNVCLLATVAALRACGGRPERLLVERVRRNPAADAALRGTQRFGRWHSIGPLRFGARLPAAAGALFVGDAAGTIDPLSGEGMCHALHAASLAVPIALEAAQAGGLTEALAARYARSWWQAFGAATARARRLARLLERRLPATAAVLLLRALGAPAFARIVAHSRTGPGALP